MHEASSNNGPGEWVDKDAVLIAKPFRCFRCTTKSMHKVNIGKLVWDKRDLSVTKIRRTYHEVSLSLW